MRQGASRCVAQISHRRADRGDGRDVAHHFRGDARTATAYLYAETEKAVAARRASGSDQRDILGLLLSAKDPETGRVMTDAELTGNLYGFMIAGHETSAVALGWSLWLLAKDQASQDRLREEVTQIAGVREIGPDEVEQLAFTRQVIQEIDAVVPSSGSNWASAARRHDTRAVQSLNANRSMSRRGAPLQIEAV